MIHYTFRGNFIEFFYELLLTRTTGRILLPDRSSSFVFPRFCMISFSMSSRLFSFLCESIQYVSSSIFSTYLFISSSLRIFHLSFRYNFYIFLKFRGEYQPSKSCAFLFHSTEWQAFAVAWKASTRFEDVLGTDSNFLRRASGGAHKFDAQECWSAHGCAETEHIWIGKRRSSVGDLDSADLVCDADSYRVSFVPKERRSNCWQRAVADQFPVVSNELRDGRSFCVVVATGFAVSDPFSGYFLVKSDFVSVGSISTLAFIV